MRKIGLVFLIIFCLVIGMMISDNSGNSYFNITQDDINKFEDYLENNEYYKTYEGLNPNVVNKIGNKCESIIDSIFTKFKNIVN